MRGCEERAAVGCEEKMKLLCDEGGDDGTMMLL